MLIRGVRGGVAVVNSDACLIRIGLVRFPLIFYITLIFCTQHLRPPLRPVFGAKWGSGLGLTLSQYFPDGHLQSEVISARKFFTSHWQQDRSSPKPQNKLPL